MKVLVTGAGGFVGRHLTAELAAAGMELILTSNVAGPITVPSGKTFAVKNINISDRNGLGALFAETKPDAVVHLAAVSHVVNAQNERETLSAVNIVGTHNVCAAAASTGKPVTFLFVSTSLVYGSGSTATNEDFLFDERSLPAPDSAYGASKLAGEFIVRSFADKNFKPFIVRPFNHIGPGQSPNFVCPGLAGKIAAAEEGSTIKVGNLKTFRDFTDVRDVVRAYRLILTKTPAEDLFVIGSGSAVRIDDILTSFIKISGKSLKTEVDAALLRDVDPPKLCANAERAKNSLGWSPELSLSETFKGIYREALCSESKVSR